MASDKALAHQLCISEFPQETESNETREVLLGGKQVQYMWTDTWADSGRERAAESCPRGSLSYFYGLFLLGLLWPIILICLVHSPYLVYLRILPGVCVHLLAKMDSTAEACG